MKNDLQQEVAELLAQISEIAARDGVGDLVGFLDRIRGDSSEVLLEIPRTAGPRRAQRRHDFKKTGNVAGRAHRKADEGSGSPPLKTAGLDYDSTRRLSLLLCRSSSDVDQ